MPRSSSERSAQHAASEPLQLPMPAQQLLPQSGPMMVLDQLTYVDDLRAEAVTTLKQNHLMKNADGSFPALGLIEMLAQTIGLYAGWIRRRANEEPRIGLLLGTRQLTLNCDSLPCGSIIKTVAEKTFESEEGLWQFQTHAYIVADGHADAVPIASAVITVFNADAQFIDSITQ